MVADAPPPTLGVDDDGLALRLLGDFQIRVGGHVLEGLRSGRARALLAYLVLHPDAPQWRKRMAFDFWADSSEGQAQTNLRNVLHLLRHAHPAIDASLHVTPTTLEWRPIGQVSVDVERFARAADAASAVDPDDVDDRIEHCRAAVDLYGGDLLSELDDEWIVPHREALRQRCRQMLSALATALIDDGRGAEAIDAARRLVVAEPLDESAHRLLIEALARSGDRAAALRAYHACATTLERDLDVAPSRATIELYESLIEGERAIDPSALDRPVSGRHQFVGRATEWRQLVAAWATAQAGRALAVLVTGEAGIGKSRIVDELRGSCAASGAAVGAARSYANEGDLGYAVVASWLRSADVAPARRQLTDGQLRELARLLPELGVPAPSGGADEATRRRRLFDATVTALTALRRPTLLIADDAQWSDRGSQELIHYLLRERPDAPVLIVLTARSSDLDATHQLSALRDGLSVLDALIEVPLERLPIEATGQLGSQLVGAVLDAESVEALFAESEGNPLFIVETVRGGWRGRGGKAELTPRLRAVIDARFRQLSEPALHVLDVAAVVDRPVSAGLLATISGLDQRSLVLGLDELWRRGILRETGTDSYEFSHGKLRDAAYDRQAPVSRRAYHGRVAESLVQLGVAGAHPVAAHVALHFEAANRLDEAVTWYQRAAIDAHQVFAHGEAIRLLDRALGLVPQLTSDVRHARELELLSLLPSVLAGVSGYGTDRMSDVHRRAAAVAAGLGVELEPAFLRSTVMSSLCRDDFATAATGAAQLAARAGRDGDAGLRIESEYLLGISAFWSADLTRARRHFEEVVAGFGPSMRLHHQFVYGHDPQVVCLSRLANTLWFLGRPDDARSTCETALGLAAEVAHPLSHDTAVIFACALAVDLRDDDLLRRCVPWLGALGMDSLPHATKREALLGYLDVLDGRGPEGIARIVEALDRCDGRNFYPGFQATITRVLLAAHAAAADPVGGLATVDRAVEARGTPLWHAEAHRLRAEFLYETGRDAEEVAAALEAGRRIAERQGAAGHMRLLDESRRRLIGPLVS